MSSESPREDNASLDDNSSSSGLLSIYNREINRLDPHNRNTAGAVLYSSVLSVTLFSCSADSSKSTSNSNNSTSGGDCLNAEDQCKPATTNDFFDPAVGRLQKLTAISSPGLLSCLTKIEKAYTSSSSAVNKTTKPLILEANDQFNRRSLVNELVARKSTQKNLTEASTDGLRAFELQAMIRLQINRLLQSGGIPLRPTMTAVERGIKETELLTFTSLCSSDLFRSNQLQQFEEMILEQTKALPNFTGAMVSGDGEDGSVLRRKYFRYMSAFTFVQVLSQELMTEPMILKRYYEMTDELLYCLHWPPPSRRNRRDTWNFSFPASNDVDVPNIIKVDSITMTPAGKSVAILKEINENHANPWLTAYYGDLLAGFRLGEQSKGLSTESSFFVVTDDDVRINVFPGPFPETLKKPDKCGTICLTASYPNGISMTICTSGDVRILSNAEQLTSTMLSMDTKHQYEQYPLLSEHSRFIGKNGSICRKFPHNSTHPFESEIFFADGTREIYLKSDYSPKKYVSFLESSNIFESYLLTLLPIDVRWITLGPMGTIESCNLSEDGVTWLRNPTISETIMEEFIDAETKSISRYFRDGRLFTFHHGGPSVIIFPDHTQYVIQPKIGVTFISRGRGWPEIEIDNDVDSVCRSHCQGLEVPINKSGDRVRFRVGMPDGLAVVVKYDTRVTAKTNGSLKMVHRTRASIIAKDDGSVIFSPSTAWTREDEESFVKDCKIDDVLVAVDPRQAATATNFSFPHTSGSVNQNGHSQSASATEKAHSALTSGGGGGSVKGGTAKVRTATSGKGKTTAGAATNARKLKAEANPKVMNTIRESDEQHTGHDLFSSTTEPDAVIYANVVDGKCTIKDYEFNSFEMDLGFNRRAATSNSDDVEVEVVGDVHNRKRENSMDVTILLAGEVPGLKPPAVARFPKPPRLFIINRDGEATEVMGVQDVSSLENKVRICPDATRFDATALISPAELGPAKLIRYFTQKKLLALTEDSFPFSTVFGVRNYHFFRHPASTLHFIQTQTNINYMNMHSDLSGQETLPKSYESLSLIERTPLSQDGYQDIVSSFKRCDEFRTKRLQSIDRFAVDDPRTQDQIEEEEQIIKRLKQAYKAAKLNAAKKKEHNKEREDRIAEEDEDEEEGTSQTNSKGGATKGSKDQASPTKRNKEITILESQQEDKEDEEDMEQFSDDEDGEVDPEIAITKTAFEDYCSPSALVSWGGDVMSVGCLQEVFIRIFNRFVSQEELDFAISHTEEIEPELEELTLNEFRAVYRSIKQLLNGETLRKPKSPSAPTSPREDSLDGDGSEITGGSAYIAMMSSPPPSGLPGRKPIHKSAPPLNFNALEWDIQNVNNMSSMEQKEPMTPTDDFAQGSAMNHIRKVKSNNVKM